MYIKLLFLKRQKSNIFSNIISWVLGTKFSHVALEFQIDTDLKIYHASFFGASELYPRQLPEYVLVTSRLYELNPTVIQDAKRKCENLLGTPYGFEALLGMFLKIVFRIDNTIGVDGEHSLTCSEFAAIGLQAAGVLKSVDGVDLTDPQSLYILTRSS